MFPGFLPGKMLCRLTRAMGYHDQILEVPGFLEVLLVVKHKIKNISIAMCPKRLVIDLHKWILSFNTFDTLSHLLY